MDSNTPRAKAAYLLQYMTDESTILAHIKRDFGYSMDLSELRRIKGSLPRQRIKIVQPLYTREPSECRPKQDLLLYSLAIYYERRKPHEAEHWRKVQQYALGVRYGAG